MELLFQFPDGSLIDGVIDYATRDPHVPVHTEIRFSDGRCFSSQAPGGVRWTKTINTATDVPRWEVIEIPRWLASESMVALSWCESVIGQPYDYLGAANSSSLIRCPIHLFGHWFCSQICIEVLSRCGALNIPPGLSPASLYRYVKRVLAGENPKALAACPEFIYQEGVEK